jgi:hypothetical protein
MKQKIVVVEISGKSPLLINRFQDKAIDGDSKRRTGAIEKDDIHNKLYLFDGKAHLPSTYLRSAIVEAAKQFKITGKGKSTYSKLAGSVIEVGPEFSPIVGDWKEFRIAAVNPMTKGRMMVSRPRFDSWSVKFEITILDDSLPVGVLNEILQHAGNYVGVGDWRPDKKGMFGKFMLTSFQVK